MAATLERRRSSSSSSSEVEVSIEQDERRENGSGSGSNGMTSREVRIEDGVTPKSNAGDDSPGLYCSSLLVLRFQFLFAYCAC